MPLNQIDLTALVNLSSSYGDQLSHDRRSLAYFDNRSGRHELCVTDVETRASRRVTDGQLPATPRSGLVWLRDNRHVVYGKDASGNEQADLYSLDTQTLETRQLTHLATAQDIAIEAHPDGERLLVLSSRSGQMQLHWLNLQTLEMQQLTHFKNPVAAAHLSADGARIAFSANESDDPKNMDVYVMNSDGSGQQRRVTLEAGCMVFAADWSPDGQALAVYADAGGEWRAGAYRLETHGLETDDLRWFSTGRVGVAEFPRAFSPDGTWLLCLRDADASYTPVLYDVQSGAERVLQLPPGIAGGGEWLSDTRFLVHVESPVSRGAMQVYDLETDASETLRAADHGTVDPALFVAPEYLRYPSFDGAPVPTFVYTPRDAAPGQRFPAVVDVHGGPTGHYSHAFNAQAQLLADRGYVVLMPNFRGSSGYGNAWRDANTKDWGGADLQDVVHGVHYLQSRGDVIADRIAIMGGSFGGYMTYLATTKHPTLFKAGVAIIGITDLHQLHADNKRLLPALAYYFERMMGDPIKDADLWRERSAVHFAHQLQAKLLIIHGRNDPRCPLNQATGFIEKLEAAGKVQGEDFEVEIFDEGHGSADRGLRERHWRMTLDFLERHL
jgi:dipeptidyl aminopeptidase/acylaminoacyl peptidase